MTDLLDLDRLTGPAAHPWAILLGALLIGVLAVGRMTRLLTHDSFPPVEALRHWYVHAARPGWELLGECPWCMAPWVTLLDLIWAIGGTLDVDTVSGTLWWLGNLWFGAAYVVSMIVVRDEPE